MEFNEKIQALRKSKNLTQEQLAGLLFVSRAAISKWESGRGYPSIESLKMLAKVFSVSVDELLSGDEVIAIAQTDIKENTEKLHNRAFAIIDIASVLLFILPIFGMQSGDSVRSVSLFELGGISCITKYLYFITIGTAASFGIFRLILQRTKSSCRIKNEKIISSVLTFLCLLVFAFTRQPYASAFMACYLAIKAVISLKAQ